MTKDMLAPFLPAEFIQDLIRRNGFFPNNDKYPFLIYRQVFNFEGHTAKDVQALLKRNGWENSWVNGIYDYHHYHSNTHEALVIFEGECQVEIGGDRGRIYKVRRGDVVILPAGVAHKNIQATDDLVTIGAYPDGQDYDMNYGAATEILDANKNIQAVGVPASDPVYGKNGLMFNYWK
jgi:uncharacterized protein YjlB